MILDHAEVLASSLEISSFLDAKVGISLLLKDLSLIMI